MDEIAEEPHYACVSFESMQLTLQKEEEEEEDRSWSLFSFVFYHSNNDTRKPWETKRWLNSHKRIAQFWSLIRRYRPTTTTIAPKKNMNTMGLDP